MATIVCDTDAIFCTLNMKNFDRSLFAIEWRRKLKRFHLLMEIPCFRGIRKNMIQDMSIECIK
jgi:hypothetical protein